MKPQIYKPILSEILYNTHTHMHAHTKQKHKETQIYFLISIKPENTYIKKLRPNFCHTNKCK